MIIDDTIRDQVGETAYTTWKDAALADLSTLICMSQFEESITDMTGTVSDDGTHVHLPSWYSEIWSAVTTDHTPLTYKISYDHANGLTPPTQYTNTILLTNPHPAGTKITVSGRHGFKQLPAPLATILTAIIQADQSMTDRSDQITSKRIEDVSVTYATNTQTTLEHALAPYKSLISTWSLCPINPDTGGLLSMPTPHHDLPWWMNIQDQQGDDHTHDTAM